VDGLFQGKIAKLIGFRFELKLRMPREAGFLEKPFCAENKLKLKLQTVGFPDNVVCLARIVLATCIRPK
jgi:hypothetical protein